MELLIKSASNFFVFINLESNIKMIINITSFQGFEIMWQYQVAITQVIKTCLIMLLF